jgi:hypothetical protein
VAGAPTDKEKLNRTLEKICGILNDNHINDWFIFFGTLLGIVREGSCVKGDDDIDIMINCDYQKLHSLLVKEGFTFDDRGGRIKNPDTILKTKVSQNYGSIDFYMCNVNESGDFYTPWHGVISTNSYVNIDTKTFIYKEWLSTVLQLPNNYESKIINMYGSEWRIPKSGSCKMRIGRV